MTANDFLELAQKGVVIECQNMQQRREVLELFIEYGFEIGSASRAYLNPQYCDVTFMHPSFNPSHGRVACYTTFATAVQSVGNGLRYEDIRNLIEGVYKIDERNDEEFNEAFSILMDRGEAL